MVPFMSPMYRSDADQVVMDHEKFWDFFFASPGDMTPTDYRHRMVTHMQISAQTRDTLDLSVFETNTQTRKENSFVKSKKGNANPS